MPTIKQRICLMRAHNSICRYCNLPIENLAVLEIDHVECVGEAAPVVRIAWIASGEVSYRCSYSWEKRGLRMEREGGVAGENPPLRMGA